MAAKTSRDLQLGIIKVHASSCSQKLIEIQQINDGWDPGPDPQDSENDVEFARSRIAIGVLLGWAINTYENLVAMTEQLLSHPPGYNENPDEQRQKQVEVLVLSDIACKLVVALQQKLDGLTQQVNDTLDTRLFEACFRVDYVRKEAHDILEAAQKLSAEQGSQ